MQYIRHLPYIHAIERITGQRLPQAVPLTDRERTALRREASRAVPSVQNGEPDHDALAAWWLLIQFGEEPAETAGM